MSQPLQTNNKQFKIAVTFLSDYNGKYKVLNSNSKPHFTMSNNDEDFDVNTISKEAYEHESLNDEMKRNIFEEGYFTEETYPFLIKPNFSTLDSIIEINQILSVVKIDFFLMIV